MLKQGLIFLAPLSSLATSYFKPGDEVTHRSVSGSTRASRAERGLLNGPLSYVKYPILSYPGIRDPAFAFDTAEEEGQDDGDLLDTVVVVSVDGAFHGLHRTTGAVLWTTPSAAPLVRVIKSSSTLDGTYAIEPQTGALFVLPTAEDEEVENLGISVAQLVDYSPFTLAEPGKPKRIFVGVKKQTSLDIDIVTGELRSDSRCDASNDLVSRCSSSTVSILRTDYDVKVIAPNNRVLQQLAYSELSTAHDHAHRQASGQYVLGDPNGYVWSFDTNNTSRKVLRFSHPIVAAFDLYGPVAVLQKSSSRLLKLSSEMKRHLDAVADRVYIGRVEDTFFAMSVPGYPLVALTTHDRDAWESNLNLVGRWRTRGSVVSRVRRLLDPVYEFDAPASPVVSPGPLSSCLCK